jgi:CDGSH-type Zn-finger protein
MVKSVDIQCNKDGPYVVTVDGTVFAAFCRCGASNKKPYCDGEHRKVAFKAAESSIKVV